MDHFAELHVGRAWDCSPDSREKISTTRNPAGFPVFTNENERNAEDFGEIKKQLVPCYYYPLYPLALSFSSPQVFSGLAMEFSRNEDDELRSPGIMARSIPTRNA